MTKIKKLAIANRGEVAVRIIRACEDMGIETVLLHSDVDTQTLAYRLSTEQICIGPAASTESYLNISANIEGALAAGADAIHPGFGFLSENAEFARACESNRLIFVGPTPDSIDLFGDKISAKKLVEKAKGPFIPGYQGDDQSNSTLVTEAEKIGFPVIVKAAAGGGGRGMRILHNLGDALGAIESAKRECLAAFGSDRVFLEKYIGDAKHIEVQIFGDASGQVFSLLDRECTVQRRHQKIVEEACSYTLSETLRVEMCEFAVKIAEMSNYRGAGTVEFLVCDGRCYFLEMNTRLQVEHPVTELVLGVDLVKAQIMTAAGDSLLWEQDSLQARGHAIECRINVEDPYMNGMPSIGVLGTCRWPIGPGRRFEVGFEEGDEITSNYDSMIAKIIVWDENRPRAIQKMRKTLKETIIFGLKTNIPYLLEILSHPEFVEGIMTTKFIETYFPAGLTAEKPSEDEKLLAQTIGQMVGGSSGGYQTSTVSSTLSTDANPWQHSWGRT